LPCSSDCDEIVILFVLLCLQLAFRKRRLSLMAIRELLFWPVTCSYV
jgi:hypothetical protein